MGFVRTYAWLVKYPCDFEIAMEKGLLSRTKPEGSKADGAGNDLTYHNFSQFIASFEELGDDEVAPRFHYGELRLTRLNMYWRLFLRGWTYHHIEAQWSTFLGSFLAPFVVLIATLTVILNAMQVELGLMQVELGTGPSNSRSKALVATDGMYKPWSAFMNFARWFPVGALYFVTFSVTLTSAIIVVMFVHDQYFALRIIWEKRQNLENGGWRTRKSGVV